MMNLDSTTMVLVLALGNLALCSLLFFFDYGAARSPSLASWGLSRQVQAAAWVLLALGGARVLPEPLALPAGWALLIGGVALEAGSLWEAANRPRWRRAMVPLAVAAVLVFLVCYLIDDIGLRNLAALLLLGGFYLLAAAALAQDWRQAGMLQRVLAIAIALLALVVAARGLLVLVMPDGWRWLSHELLRQLSSAALYLLMLAGAFGCLLLARERLQAELARRETVDTVADVPNRRGFFAMLAPWMALARRPGLPTALVVLDLDGFKRVNDGYGHPAGDVVLRHVAALCKRQLRDSDQLARLVGGEFALLLPRTGAVEAALVAERMRAAIETTPVKTERAMISMTASFGVTTIRADDSNAILLQRAGEAMRAAKAAGRNRVMQAEEGGA
ncbi:GGDEF domain-containing protein [Massilia sp. IC2-278]|uniref:GGDEF domain-containing protein n=1 Tax=Massilia sp. IC2-278 TaxID=2887200 RepID=UPI001E4571F5|nr:GGDEF domain-containing protein [Massilia sp. IC2-278]MCC2958921.1 GGDEF domain-containing protein [Massilia sp. IC2-278]